MPDSRWSRWLRRTTVNGKATEQAEEEEAFIEKDSIRLESATYLPASELSEHPRRRHAKIICLACVCLLLPLAIGGIVVWRVHPWTRLAASVDWLSGRTRPFFICTDAFFNRDMPINASTACDFPIQLTSDAHSADLFVRDIYSSQGDKEKMETSEWQPWQPVVSKLLFLIRSRP
jgi:hypothetical protein